MKISNGSTAEFIIALVLIIFGVWWLKIIGIIVVGHCIYLWTKKRKENNAKKSNNNR